MNLQGKLARLELKRPRGAGAWCACPRVVIYAEGDGDLAAAATAGAVCPVCGLRRRPDGATVLLPDNGREGLAES